MSIINDYSISYLAEQRQADFRAEAAADRLARIAIAERPRRNGIKVRRMRNPFHSVRPAQAR